MDDVIFSVDNLEDARLIANEAIELFDSRGLVGQVEWKSRGCPGYQSLTKMFLQ